MRYFEFILNEAREAPLYHFTQEANFFRILNTDVLMAPGSGSYAHGGKNPTGRIYFTRDYQRQFIPAKILAGSWGFRVNQDLLRQRFGKRLKAGGQSQWTEKKRQAWLADPKNADDIARAKAGERSGSSHNGANVTDLALGRSGMASRWESEEHLDIGQLPNFHEYITGIVYAGGKQVGGYDHGVDFKKRNPRQNDALDQLCKYLMSHFRGEAGFKQRDALMEYMTKFNIPFVYQQQDFPAKQVKDRMIQLWREAKAERARRAETDKTHWIAIRNVQGGGVSTSGPSNPITAAKQILGDMPEKFPEGIFGMKELTTDKTYWFINPYTDPKATPNLWMGQQPPKHITQNMSTQT